MFKTIIISVMILTAALPANAEVGPGLGNTDNVASRSQSYAQVCTNDVITGSLFMRNGPGRNFQKVKEIPNGDVVLLSGGKYSQDDYWWWNVSYKGKRGWVRADYVCGDPQ